MRLLFVVLLACLDALCGCSSGSGHGDPVDLSGTWVSDGYYCPALVRHTETVQIEQTGEHIVATKTVGDRCVPAGHQTFAGTMHGQDGRVDIWLGSPGITPAIALRAQKLSVTTPNRFTIDFGGSHVAFIRPHQAATPSGVPWWLIAVAVILVLAVLVVFLRRRGRRVSGHEPRRPAEAA